MGKKWLLALIILVVALVWLYSPKLSEMLTGLSASALPADSYVSDSGELQLYFCPREDCETALVNFIDSAQQSVHCALFELDLPLVQQKLLEKQAEGIAAGNPEKAGKMENTEKIEVKIVTDDGYLEQFNYSFVKADFSGLMHNKFCVVDGNKVSTGSMNPTKNDAHKNNNNFLIINSPILSNNYEDEFQEMWNGEFKSGQKVSNPKIILKDIKIKNYFCPDDHCADRVKEELKKAQHSIYFMAFSFTHEEIANILMLKHSEGLEVRGVMEARQVTKDAQFSRLAYQGIKILKDKNPGMMHHKVFIIDNETVITGSFNPTQGGDKRNDENILIITSSEIAKEFVEEFEKVYGESQGE